MIERGNEKIVLTGVKPEEIQVALGYLGVSGYTMEIVPADQEVAEQFRLGYATKGELLEFSFLSNDYDSSQTVGGLWARLHSSQARINGSWVGGKEQDSLELFKVITREGKAPEVAVNIDTLALMLGADSLRSVPYVGPQMERFARDFVASRLKAESQEADQEPKLGYATQEEIRNIAMNSAEDYSQHLTTRLFHGLDRITGYTGNVSGSLIYRYDEDTVELFKTIRINGKAPELALNVDTLEAMLSAGTLRGLPNFGFKIEQLAKELVDTRTAALEETEGQ